MTFPLFEGTSPIHKDHEEEHKQLILYLNDVDGNTVLCDEDRMPVQHITPVQYRGVCFDNRLSLCTLTSKWAKTNRGLYIQLNSRYE